MDKPASLSLPSATNYALVVELKTTVDRMQDVEREMEDVQLALKDDQEEVESYTDEIADCCDRIKAIDEFVCDIEAGNVPTMTDAALVVSNMAEERDEEENMLKALSEARSCHEQQLQQLTTQFATLQEERLMLQKKSSQLWCVLGRSGVFELVLRRLVERSVKTL